MNRLLFMSAFDNMH